VGIRRKGKKANEDISEDAQLAFTLVLEVLPKCTLQLMILMNKKKDTRTQEHTSNEREISQ